MMEEQAVEGGNGPRKRRWKDFFLRGMAVLLPTVITAVILFQVGVFVEENVIQHLNGGVQEALDGIGFYDTDFGPRKLPEDWGATKPLYVRAVRWFLDYAFGAILGVLAVCAVGLLIGTLIGRRIWQAIESRVVRLPMVRVVYPFTRQVIDFLFSDKQVSFRSVVAIEYPRKGVWAIGFLTGSGFEALRDRAGGDLWSVFIPSSPTPMTGYTVFITKDEIIPLGITIEEAFRMVVSGGVITPRDRSAFEIPAEAEESKNEENRLT